MRRSRDTPLTQDIRQIGRTQYTRTVTPDGSHGEGSTGYAFAKSGGRNRPRMVCHGRRKATFCGGFPFSLVGACRPSSTKRGYPLAPDFDHGLACAFAEILYARDPSSTCRGMHLSTSLCSHGRVVNRHTGPLQCQHCGKGKPKRLTTSRTTPGGQLGRKRFGFLAPPGCRGRPSVLDAASRHGF